MVNILSLKILKTKIKHLLLFKICFKKLRNIMSKKIRSDHFKVLKIIKYYEIPIIF